MIENHTWYSKLAMVSVAFIIPIADSLTVTINRIRRGQSPFVGGKDHTTHHLSYAGLSDSQVALVMIAIASISLALISTLRFVEDAYQTIYQSFLLIYAVGIIGFLYSTTQWKKSKAVFLSKIDKEKS